MRTAASPTDNCDNAKNSVSADTLALTVRADLSICTSATSPLTPRMDRRFALDHTKTERHTTTATTATAARPMHSQIRRLRLAVAPPAQPAASAVADADAVVAADSSAPCTNSSSEQPNTSAILTSISISGTVVPVSHLLTVLSLTDNMSASCFCVNPRAFLIAQIRAAKSLYSIRFSYTPKPSVSV